MVNKFKKSQPKVQQEAPKANMLKRVGGKFKKAFSKKKRKDSPVQQPNQASVQQPQLQTTPLPELITRKTEQVPTVNRPGNAPTDIDSTHHAPTETPLRDPVDCIPSTPQQTTESSGFAVTTRNRLVRSYSSPPLPSSPTTETSSETLCNSPDRSDGSSPRSIIKFTQLVKKISDLSKRSHDAQFDHLKSEEADNENAEWLSVLKWAQVAHYAERTSLERGHEEEVQAMKQDRSTMRRKLEMKSRELKASKKEIGELIGGHRDQVMDLEREHAEEVQRLKQDRSTVRRKLEMKGRELKAAKREVVGLRVCVEELGRVQPALNSHDDDDDRTGAAESGNEDGGGVVILPSLLADENEDVAPTTTTTTIMKKEKGAAVGDAPPCDGGRGDLEDTEEDFAPRYTKEEKGKYKEDSTKETLAREKRVLRQLLLDDSTPTTGANATQLAAIGEVEASTTPQGPTVFFAGGNSNNNNEEEENGLQTQLHHLRRQNGSLTATLSHTRRLLARASSTAASAHAELAHLRESDHFAQLQFGHLHAANAGYRAALEEDDVNPARTAHFDDLITRKDEAFVTLESRAAQCAEALAEEQKERAIDGVYHLRLVAGLEKELAHRVNMTAALVEGRDELKGQNEEIVRFFRGKIYLDDAVKVILRDCDIMKKDREALTKIVQERGCYVLDAEKAVADLKAEGVRTDHAIERERLTHRQAVQSLNGLTAINNQLAGNLDIAEHVRQEREAEISVQLQAQQHELDRINSASGVDRHREEARNAHVAGLSNEVERLAGLAEHWRVRALERAGDFGPMWRQGEINDWDGEEMRWRLHEAGKRNGELEAEVARLRGVEGSRWLVNGNGPVGEGVSWYDV